MHEPYEIIKYNVKRIVIIFYQYHIESRKRNV